MEYKKKNIILLASFVLMVLVSYQFAIKRTLDMKLLCEQQQTEIDLLSNASEKIAYYTQQNRTLDSILKSFEVTVESSYEQTLLNAVTKHAKSKKLQIISFQKPHVFKDDDFEIKTYTISLKGNFSDLFQFHKLMEKDRLGKIMNVFFEKKRNYKYRRDDIYYTLQIQKVES